ncbi:hypothetical protein M408DRAFT_327204 [Serendipita vermifera MAFF 305830]|uniref:Calcineurin-like phosphoesterase domain-containing protein n=1 Tax=Serendipita vermifera MAFF 305830 TaxID=933852 RepID=A0A0C2XS56_SERVB|nr:hypothetical protein M408DRAFT_327204 [Serendipita vermifera MAFF 305830]
MKSSLKALKTLTGSAFRSHSSQANARNSSAQGASRNISIRASPTNLNDTVPDPIAPEPTISMDAEDFLEPIITRDAVVHFAYDVNNPPPRPDADAANTQAEGSSWTRFVCISDTHCNMFKVPDGDVLLHAGDLTHSGRFKQMKPTIDWIKQQMHPHKIIIAGNHDLTLDHDWYLEHGDGWHRTLENPPDIRKLMEPREGDTTFHYLQYESLEIMHGNTRWKAFGSPGSPWFGGWAFNYDRETEAQGITDQIPEDVDILLTHGPPRGILDLTSRGVLAGCAALKSRVEQLRPAIHIFGHIHEDRGAIVQEWPDSDATNTTTTATGSGDEATQENPSTRRKQRKFTVFVNAAVQPGFQNKSLMTPGTSGYHYPAIIVDIRNQ